MIVGNLEIRLMADIARLQRDMTAARQSVSNATAGMERAANAAKAAIASIAAGVGVQQLASMVDQYVKFTSQLKLATQSQREYNTAYADVKRIAAGSTQGLQETGVLYARIANGTRELGVSQKQLSNIVETVNLSLLVSGATASEAASAQLQLSQAFASGTLRGEEFNSVNEAAPRLMKALADGIGVPVGALKKMAEEGLITSEIMANVLPKALASLREEAKNIQTISGSFVLLKNNTIEFVGSTAQASGAVSAIAGLMTGLANNLHLVAGALLTVVAVKAVNFLDSLITRTVASVRANNALIASNVATAQANATATAQASLLANARLAEIRAATVGAASNIRLALTMNGLVPAQRAAAAAAATHSAAMFGLVTAQSAAAASTRALNALLALTGGPFGLIITALGIAATAWGAYEYSQTKANEKAASDTKASAGEITESLSKVNAMLRERIALQNAGASSAVTGEGTGSEELRETLREINALKQRGGQLDASDQIRLISLQGIYSALNKEILDNVDLKRESEANGQIAKDVVAVRERLNGVNQQYIKDLGVLKSALDKGAVSQDEYTELVSKLASETYKASDAYKESEARAKKHADAQKNAYESATKAAGEFIAGLKHEREELGLGGDQLRMLNAARAAALAPTASLRLEIMESALALTLEKEAVDASTLSREQYDSAIKAQAEARAQEQSSLQGSIDQMQQEIDTYGMGAAAITRYNLAKLEARRADLIAADNYGTEMLAVMDSIDKLTQLEGLQNVRDDLDSLFETGRVETFGQALRSAFGNAGNALGELTGAFQDYSDRQAAAEMARAKVRLEYGDDEKRIAREVGKINAIEERERVSAYADMAGAAKGFFKENSTGYRVMEAAERTYRAIELANQMQSLYTHLFVTTTKATATATGQGVETAAVVAGEAARNTAKVPGVFMAFMSALGPWGMAAAAVAVAAVLGGAFGGGGGSVSLTQQRQERQGTGTVLGSDAKSESIARSLDAVEGATLQGLGISNGMLTSLRNIEAGIGQFASLLVRTTGVTGDFGKDMGKNVFDSKAIGIGGAAGGAVLGAMGGAYVGMGASQIGLMLGGPVGMAIGAVLGAVLGKQIGKVMTSVFGGKKTVEDTGFAIDPISFQGIQNGALSSMQYADIKTSGGWLGKDKNNTALEGLGLEGNRQIANVLLSLYDTVFEAGTMIGLGADAFADELNGYVVDIGKISLKGKTADEIQKELSAVFSKVGDDLAKFGVGGLEQFQKVGEGYLETLTRVATNYQAVTVVTDSMGMTFGAMGLASVGARERLIDLVGGLDEFTSSADQFLSDFYTDQERANSLRARINPTLDQFGIKTGADDSLQQFRSVVTGLDLTTEAGARAYATLMQIAPAFKQIADVDAARLEARRDLEIEVMELLGNKSGALAASRAAELAGLDASLRPLQERVYALQDEATALETANSLLSLQAQIYELNGNKAGAAAVLAQQQAIALAALDPALRGATLQLWGLQAAAKATEQVKTDAAALMGGVDGAFSVLQKVVERQKKALQEEINVRTKSIQTIEALSQSLRSTLDGMTVQGREVEDRQAAQAQIQAALAIAKASGKLPSADDLKNALSVVSKDASTQFATQQDYLRDFYATRNGIEDLAGLTDKTLSTEERSLKKLEDQVKQYDLMLEREQEQIDVLKGISVTGLSIEQALAALHSAVLAAGSNPVNSAGSAISDAYKSALGRAPDQAGLDFWKDKAASGISVDTIVGAIKGSPEAQIQKLYKDVLGRTADAGGLKFWLDKANSGMSLDTIREAMLTTEEAKKKLRGFAVGTNYLPSTMPILAHEGERIIPAADNRELMRRLTSPSENNQVLVAAVARLTREVESMRAEMFQAMYQTAKNTGRSANSLEHIDRVGVEIRDEENA